MDKTTQDRINDDAKNEYPPEGFMISEPSYVLLRKGYVAGATAENSRAQEREKVFEDVMQRVLSIASWADDPYKSTLMRVVRNAQEQWKDGKGKEVDT